MFHPPCLRLDCPSSPPAHDFKPDVNEDVAQAAHHKHIATAADVHMDTDIGNPIRILHVHLDETGAGKQCSFAANHEVSLDKLCQDMSGHHDWKMQVLCSFELPDE